MSFYEDIVQAWVDRRDWEVGFHDQCKELVTAFLRVFHQQTGAHPIRPLRVDDWAPRAERDYSLAEALQPLRCEATSGRTVLCGYEVCMGLLLEGPPEESPRWMLAIHLKVQAPDPGDSSQVTLSLLGHSKTFRLPLVLPPINVELTPDDKPFPVRPPEEADTERKQITWLHACLRNLRRLPPERRGSLAEAWQSLAQELGIGDDVHLSEEPTSMRRAEALKNVQQVLLALGTGQDDKNQCCLEELSREVSRALLRLLIRGEEDDAPQGEGLSFSFRPFAQSRAP